MASSSFRERTCLDYLTNPQRIGIRWRQHACVGEAKTLALAIDTADQKRSLPKEWVAGSSAILRCCFRFADYFRCIDALKLTVMHEDAHVMRISQPHHRYSQAICATRLKIDGRNSHAALL